MLGGSLFERLKGDFDTSVMDESEILYQSITNNLANILSSNMGNSQTVQDYGKVDLNNMDLNPKHSQKHIEESLQQSISLYEKRLKKCLVTVEPEPYLASIMYIYVDGEIIIRGRYHKVSFKAQINGDGSIKVNK